MKLYPAGLAPGTWKNKAVQAKCYLQFTALHKFNLLAPDPYDMLAYTLHLHDTLLAPATVMN